ncbi:MAG: hypothetical protein ACOX0E_00530 [Syntrophomonadaceae bacterium]|jgi:septal ring factor EnvC (AmiA/AmiB activator)
MNMEPVSVKEPRVDQEKTVSNKGLPFFLVVFLWLALVCLGFYLAKEYIDNSLQNIQQNNAMNIKILEERIGEMTEELRQIEFALSEADETLSSSSFTQEKLNEKIEELDQRLSELSASLEILKEAPNAVN